MGVLHNDPAFAGFLTLLEQDIRVGKNTGSLPEGLARSMLAVANFATASSESSDSLEDEIEGSVALESHST